MGSFIGRLFGFDATTIGLKHQAALMEQKFVTYEAMLAERTRGFAKGKPSYGNARQPFVSANAAYASGKQQSNHLRRTRHLFSRLRQTQISGIWQRQR